MYFDVFGVEGLIRSRHKQGPLHVSRKVLGMGVPHPITLQIPLR